MSVMNTINSHCNFIMGDENKKLTIRAPMIVLVVLAAIIVWMNWRDIRNGDLYMRTFERQKWEQREAKSAEFLARLDELDRRECNIWLRASRDVIPVEIERNALFGMERERATKMALDEFTRDKELCEEHGISGIKLRDSGRGGE